MLKTVDVGLMANHLPVHKALVKRLELYAKTARNPQLQLIIGQQIGTLKNHMQVMNLLLDPNQQHVTLPPIPQSQFHASPQFSGAQLGIEDQDIALDGHFTAMGMANENFASSLNMKDPQVKHIHLEMGLQQAHIATQYEMLIQKLGWSTHPNAASAEQSKAMMPMQPVNFQNQHMGYM